MSRVQPERIVQAALLLVFAAVVLLALDFAPEARLFPILVGCAGCVLAGALLLLAASPPHVQGGGRRLVIGLAAAPVYSGLVWAAGFYVASPAALLALPYLLGYRRLAVLVPLTAVLTAVFAGLFSYTMDVSMPPGLLGDWFLNRFVYDP